MESIDKITKLQHAFVEATMRVGTDYPQKWNYEYVRDAKHSLLNAYEMLETAKHIIKENK